MARNWPGHTIRIDDELWDRFGRGVEAIRVNDEGLSIGLPAIRRQGINTMSRKSRLAEGQADALAREAEQRMALFEFDQRMADRAEQDRLREDLGG